MKCMWFLLVVVGGCSQTTEKKNSEEKGSVSDKVQPSSAENSKSPNPLSGKSLAEICENDELALIKWSFAELQNGFASLCCQPGGLQDDGRCELDWPSSDVPSCELYDEMRNGIFARYGYPFSSAKWQKRFADVSWYKKRDDFSNDWLTQQATQNVATLKKMKTNRTNCMD